MQIVINLFDKPALSGGGRTPSELLRERACGSNGSSTGQSTSEDQPYKQGSDEWVLLLTGAAGLWIEGEGERDLRPGDHLLVPARRCHRVTWTAKNQPTVWLAVHFSDERRPGVTDGWWQTSFGLVRKPNASIAVLPWLRTPLSVPQLIRRCGRHPVFGRSGFVQDRLLQVLAPC